MKGSDTISISTFRNYRISLFISGLLLYGLTGCQTAAPPKEETLQNKSPTPEILEVLPEDTDKPISRDTALIIRFSLPIDPATVIVNQEDNQCSGNVQLSADGFQTCIRIKSPSIASDRQEFKFTPQGIYKPGGRYRLRLTSGIKTLEGGTLNGKEHSETFTMYSTQLLGAPGNDRGLAIFVDGEDQVYIAGKTSSGADESDVFLVKFAAEGHQIWIRQVGFKMPPKTCLLRITDARHLRVMAHYPGTELSRMVIVDYDTEGHLQWKRELETKGPAAGSAIAMDYEGNVYASGNLEDPLIKILPNGKSGWKASMKNPVELNAATLDNDSHIFAAGTVRHKIDGQNQRGGRDGFLIKMHRSGIKRWTRQFGTSSNDELMTLIIGKSGYLALIQSEPSSPTMLLKTSSIHKFSSEGEMIWERFLGELLPGPVFGIHETEEEHLLLAGYSLNPEELEKAVLNEEAFVAKMNSKGNLIWLQRFGGKGNDRALAVTQGPTGTVYATGYTTGSIDGSHQARAEDIFLAYFNSEGERY